VWAVDSIPRISMGCGLLSSRPNLLKNSALPEPNQRQGTTSSLGCEATSLTCHQKRLDDV